jgi:hypothetical protein
MPVDPVKDYIFVTEFIEIDSEVPDLGLNGNSQTADRFLHNPIHNLVIGLLQDIDLTPSTIVYIPSRNAHEIDECRPECEWKSTSIPQYFTSSWLLGVEAEIGLVQGLDPPTQNDDSLQIDQVDFINHSTNPIFSQMIDQLDFHLYSFPQRPEYGMLGFQNELAVRPNPDTLILQTSNGREGEEDLEYQIGISRILSFGSDLTPISFPPGTGIEVQYGDIVLSKYSWKNPANYLQPEGTRIVLRLRYRLDIDLVELYQKLVQILESIGWEDASDRVGERFALFGLSFDQSAMKNPSKPLALTEGYNPSESMVRSSKPLTLTEGYNPSEAMERYRNLYTTSIDLKTPLPPGKSKSFSPSTFLPSPGSIVTIIPQVGHHTTGFKIRLEIDGKKFDLHQVSFGHLGKSQAAHWANEGNEKNLCLHTDRWHLPYHGLENCAYLRTEKRIKIKESNQALIRLIGYHFNPHPILIEGKIGMIIYWTTDEEFPPSVQRLQSDLCQPADLENRLFCHCSS